MSKKIITFLKIIISGLVLGALAKIGDVIPQGNIFYNFISGFGDVSSGFTFWIFVCLFINIKSENRTTAVVNVVLFLASMLISYYAYSKFVVGYFSSTISKFWALMLIPSAIASYIIYDIKNKQRLKILVTVVAVSLGLFNIIFIEGFGIYSLTIEGFLFLLIGIILFKKEKERIQ